MLELKRDSIDDLDDSLKALYQEKDGVFELAVSGMPNVSEYEDRIQKMDGKINELLGEKKKADAKRKEAEELSRKEAEEAARKSNDVDALTKSYEEKIANITKELTGQYEPEIEQLKGLLHNSTVEATANKLASKLAVPGSADALALPIKQRLKMEIRDGKAVTVVTDANGSASAYSLDDLEKEFQNNPAYAPIIVGSKATGGGANGSNGGAGNNQVTRSDFDAMAADKKMSFIKEGGKIVD